jgi:hypothetical protein
VVTARLVRSVLLGGASLLAACAPATPAAPRVAQRVTADLAARGRARVLITLRDPVGAAASDAEREAAISAAQEAVFARLPAGQFSVVRRYRNVPGLALVVSGQALEVLRVDPRVVSIEADEAGGN